MKEDLARKIEETKIQHVESEERLKQQITELEPKHKILQVSMKGRMCLICLWNVHDAWTKKLHVKVLSQNVSAIEKLLGAPTDHE